MAFRTLLTMLPLCYRYILASNRNPLQNLVQPPVNESLLNNNSTLLRYVTCTVRNLSELRYQLKPVVSQPNQAQ